MLQHELSNDLGMAAGYAELLSADPAVSPSARATASIVGDSVFAAGAKLSRLQALTRRATSVPPAA